MSDNNIKIMASDSHNILELRQKLIDQQNEENKQKTKEKIDQMKNKILDHISDNVHERISINKESLSLFDNNKNPAPYSKTVQSIQHMLSEEA